MSCILNVFGVPALQVIFKYNLEYNKMLVTRLLQMYESLDLSVAFEYSILPAILQMPFSVLRNLLKKTTKKKHLALVDARVVLLLHNRAYERSDENFRSSLTRLLASLAPPLKFALGRSTEYH